MDIPDVLKAIEEALGRDCYRIEPSRKAELEASLGLTEDELLRALVGYSKGRSRSPISQFKVGAAGLTAEGEIFLSVNLEYAAASFAQTIHAEQFLVSWSRSCSSSPLVTLAVSAPPCGHCRQFMREFDPAGKLRLLIADEPPVEAGVLLPRAFTPRDLGVEEPFFAAPLALQGVTSLEDAARRAAAASYSPYSGMRAGAAVRTRSGAIYAGSALENAAYNPSLPPFQAALVSCHAHGVAVEDIESVVLCQGDSRICYSEQARILALALGVAPEQYSVVGP